MTSNPTSNDGSTNNLSEIYNNLLPKLEKDNRFKYIELARFFENSANGVTLSCKQSQIACEGMAKRLATIKPKSGPEFEKVEAWKDFVLKTATNNDKAIEFMQGMKSYLDEIMKDFTALIDASNLRDTIQFQSDVIVEMMNDRDNRANEIRSAYKANIK